MPGGDRTGPAGGGAMTGRGAGYCSGNSAFGYANSPGFGRGRGFGRSFRRAGGRFGAGFGGWGVRGLIPAGPVDVFPAPEEELSILKVQAVQMQEEMTRISKRIAELETDE